MQTGEITASVLHIESTHADTRIDSVAIETPVSIEINGIAHAVMLASPIDIEDFAFGFALTEGMIDDVNQIYDIQIQPVKQGVIVKLEIASSCFARLKDKRRQLTGTTGCGICGAESLDHVLRPIQTMTPPERQLSTHTVHAMLSTLDSHQTLQPTTGATHAAAWFNQKGELKLLREDIGRHNALDKVIGAAMRQPNLKRPDGPILVTSRASMEMVQKALIAKTRYLIALSAPTSLAIELAKQNGLCLIGFARKNAFNVYSHADYLSQIPIESTTANI